MQVKGHLQYALSLLRTKYGVSNDEGAQGRLGRRRAPDAVGTPDEIEELRKRHANDPPLELLRAARHDALPPDLQEEVGRFVSSGCLEPRIG